MEPLSGTHWAMAVGVVDKKVRRSVFVLLCLRETFLLTEMRLILLVMFVGGNFWRWAPPFAAPTANTCLLA